MFNQLTQVPLDPIFKVFGEYQADARSEKINLGIGLYADDAGQVYVPPSIQKAFRAVDATNFNYAPIGGNRDFWFRQLNGIWVTRSRKIERRFRPAAGAPKQFGFIMN
ncbi:hypothetical protein IPJ72_07090 [Candidatus Peregrinibacteria bacterium]|nr:MAG: hypothetical protein IPJ72_07090 [Candidatus Peregrinibacteria bacterium]